ncbi:hypothetical protein QE152_g13054 [Popillia japonica]|uniref:Uncharacterized protein n=1 Tax=Popillia japonica TaxID=7064 RepID=A0AAW1LEW9_POPJA
MGGRTSLLLFKEEIAANKFIGIFAKGRSTGGITWHNGHSSESESASSTFTKENLKILCSSCPKDSQSTPLDQKKASLSPLPIKLRLEFGYSNLNIAACF